jgi:hypothetical protein
VLRGQAQQRLEGSHRGVPAIEAEHELVEVVRQMLGADAVMGSPQPRLEVRERPVARGSSLDAFFGSPTVEG